MRRKINKPQYSFVWNGTVYVAVATNVQMVKKENRWEKYVLVNVLNEKWVMELN